jgi:5-methyltetrahydropteroyltriglutamate--homocysteine methyltransferase
VLAEQAAGLQADVVQVDEANLTGHLQDGAWVAEAINLILDAVPGISAVHLCFGNTAARPSARHYDQLPRS